ncbi:33 kDa chaperonin [bioreactor metagenome]|uniref:33 kDa chaperonin n=1 Tax=bioreactor metagenome TaxID=1076179 RepID=A0A644T109_9ZZZZ|nr:Hsp33 family molecular chaperone HslO [Negativicutes bacterium]
MTDTLIRATVTGGIQAFAAITTELVEEARRRHDCYPVASAALGRTMTAALLLAANLKTEESITIRIVGDGPLGETIADAYATGSVRGYVRTPHIDLPLRGMKLDVGKAVGQGTIYVTRFTGLKQPFTGSAPLVSGEIAEDVTNYLMVSEQIPSSVGLGVLVNPDSSVKAAGGFIIQVLPNADDEALAQIEKNLKNIPPVSQMVQEGKSAAGIIEALFAGLPITFYNSMPLNFNCPCSRERVSGMLISLGADELTDMINEGKAEVCCHFCAEKYQFSKDELGCLLDIMDKK